MGRRVAEADLTIFELRRQGYASSQVGNKVNVDLSGLGTTPLLGREICRVEVPADAADSWVVTLAPLPPVLQQGPLTQDQGTPQAISDAFAIIEWGVGKGRSYAVVDWSVGQQFSVYGSYVSVRGVITALGAIFVPGAGVTAMSAFIAPGRVSNNARRTITYSSPIGAGGTDARAVPPFAKNFSLSTSTFAGAAVGDITVVGELILGGGIIWVTNIINVAANPILGQQLRIPLGTNFIRVGATGAIPIFTVRLTYDLAL